MRVCLWERGQVRDTGPLHSPSHGTGEYQPRGEHDCWGSALLGETLPKLLRAVSSALLAMASEEHEQNREVFVFEPAFFLILRTPRRHKPSSATHSIYTYCKHSRTAFNWPGTEQRSIRAC